MNHPEITLVLARAANGVIGAGGKMPWHLPADLRRFKQITMGRPMIMGRKTFDSLPAVLEGRRHIVLTRDPDWPKHLPLVRMGGTEQRMNEFIVWAALSLLRDTADFDTPARAATS